MSGKAMGKLQSLKALERAPQGTLIFRPYLPTVSATAATYNTCGDSHRHFPMMEKSVVEKQGLVKKGLMNELLTGRKRIKMKMEEMKTK